MQTVGEVDCMTCVSNYLYNSLSYVLAADTIRLFCSLSLSLC